MFCFTKLNPEFKLRYAIYSREHPHLMAISYMRRVCVLLLQLLTFAYGHICTLMMRMYAYYIDEAKVYFDDSS